LYVLIVAGDSSDTEESADLSLVKFDAIVDAFSKTSVGIEDIFASSKPVNAMNYRACWITVDQC
jgi:hypothetical protein